MKSENKTSKTKIQINKEKLPNCIFDIFKTVIFLFAIISVVFTFFIKDVTIDGESMKDTLFDGDRAGRAAALKVCEVRRLADAPNLRLLVAIGDSLLHGRIVDPS